MESTLKRENWKSPLGFLLAAVGSAVGLGNIWRFSYMAYSNGGGAFLIPYFVALLTAGIPLLLLEFALGHRFRGSAPVAYGAVGRRWEWLGWWVSTLVMFGIEIYYVVIISWCLNYFFLSFGLRWGSDPNAFFFKRFLSLSPSPMQLGGVEPRVLLGLAFVWFLTWFIASRGIQKGIEAANKVFMPLLFLLTAVLVFWSLRLSGASAGISAYLRPDFSKLLKPGVWIDAYSQIFFTLSLAQGIMVAYASYLPERSNITRDAVAVSLLNCGYSIFAGFAVFATLGFMATAQGKPIDAVVSQSIGLAFVAYPKAVALMPAGSLFGAIFFFCLVVAGLSSCVSLMEAFVSAYVDKFGAERRRVVTVLSVLGFAGGIVFTTRAGLHWINIVDHFITDYGLVLSGLFESVMVGWFLGTHFLRSHMNRVSTFRVGGWWDMCVRYLIPLVLFVIFTESLVGEFLRPYHGYRWLSLVFIGGGWLAVTIILATVFYLRRWKS